MKNERNEDYLKLPNLIVLQEVATRWNSILAMLRRLVKLRQAVNMTLIETGKDNLVIIDSEYRDMGILASFLVDFEKATQIVSGEKYPTISFIQRIIIAFEKRLVTKESDVPFIAETSKKSHVE